MSGTLARRNSGTVVAHTGADAELAANVLSHLAAQIGSAERMLEVVLEQGGAIRRKDVHSVVRLAGMLDVELRRREGLEEQRSELLRRSGQRLGIAPEGVTVSSLSRLMGPESAAHASARSAQLTGLLHELQREHMVNRALMRVELSFLDHLLCTLALEGTLTYDASGSAEAGARRPTPDGGLHVLDLEA
jgi:hypothetical protein